MTPTDEQILEAYHQGFKDELRNTFSEILYTNDNQLRLAYIMGSNHAKDSVLDNLSDQEILKRIKGYDSR